MNSSISGMIDGQVNGRRTAAQTALADGQGERIHHADKWDDARSLAVGADLLADGPQIAPVGADAATLGGKPDILVPQVENTLQAVIGFVEETGNGKPPRRARRSTTRASTA